MKDLVHKRAPRNRGKGPRSVCGRYGYTTFLWKNQNCPACMKLKK